jgi:hypothetical protein
MFNFRKLLKIAVLVTPEGFESFLFTAMIRTMVLRSRAKLAGAAVAGVVFLMLPSAAWADAGIPMMPVRYPAILLFLLPVILIETIYLTSQLGTKWRRTLTAVTGINILTTALGYPLAWALYTGLDRLWDFPDYGSGMFQHMGWLPVWVCSRVYPQWLGVQVQLWPVLVMFVLLLFPSFFFSGLIKGWMTESYDLLHSRGEIRHESWMATRLSYLFLASSGCLLLYLTYRGM